MRLSGDQIELVAAHGDVPRPPLGWRVPVSRGNAFARAIVDGQTVHNPDTSTLKGDEWAEARELARRYGIGTVLSTPLLREGAALGAITIRRTEVRPFTSRQVQLLETFADQAAIAIANVALFQELQEKNRQLESASQHKSQFLANMSHELRTPLNAILGYTELIVDGIYGEPPEKIAEVLGRVELSGRHLLGLINDVLDLSKMEAGQLQLSLAEYRIKDVVYAVLSALEPLAVEKGLALEVDLAADLPVASGDEARLRQVLLNLVGNALKFTEAGFVRVSASVEGEAFRVSVRDSGPGIAEADRAKIFEEFQQAEGGAVAAKGGTGLGLSIAKRIVELHGGRIGVESIGGQGSTFWFRIPSRVTERGGSR
jgi:signal transduction histidine kinase